VNGRKRHILVDTLGLLLTVVVHPASIQDRDGAKLVLSKAAAKLQRLQLVWADKGYEGALVAWVREHLGWVLEVVQHPWSRGAGQEAMERPPGFHVLRKRWIVERTFAWLGLNRRLSRDFEALAETEESWVYVAMIRLMLRRLGRPPG